MGCVRKTKVQHLYVTARLLNEITRSNEITGSIKPKPLFFLWDKDMDQSSQDYGDSPSIDFS